MQLQFGISQAVDAAEAAHAVERRLLKSDAVLVADLQEAEDAAKGEPMREGQALKLVQALKDYEQQFGHMLKQKAGN